MRAFAICSLNQSSLSVLITCSLVRAATYVEEEFTVDYLGGRGVRQVSAKNAVTESHLFELLWVELLVTRNGDWAKLLVGDQLLLAAECVAHELHCAVVERRQVQLTLNREDDVQVLLWFDEVTEVRRNHLCCVWVLVRCDTQGSFLWLLLLLEHKLLARLVKGLIFVLLVADEVRHEARAHQIELLLHRKSRFRWVHDWKI